MRIKHTYCFDDVLLTPQYSEIKSRKEIDLSSSLHFLGDLQLPIISSPMDTVTGSSMAIAMHHAGGIGIIHRYNSIEEQAALVNDVCMEGRCNVGAAVGVTGDFEERACALYDAGAKVICVDVAHGHHALVKKALKTLRSVFGDKIHIMAGNVATVEAFNDLADWGANSIRVGVGGGSICSTRIQTGSGVPTLHSIFECARSDRNAILIADGGIKNSGDIVKALAAGADFVMLGSLLAGTKESPGTIVYNSLVDKKTKEYRGMASVEAQIDWRGHTSSIEGVTTTIDYKGPVRGILDALEAGIRSGLSYSGVRSIQDLQSRGKFILQSSLGMIESRPPILY